MLTEINVVFIVYYKCDTVNSKGSFEKHIFKHKIFESISQPVIRCLVTMEIIQIICIQITAPHWQCIHSYVALKFLGMCPMSVPKHCRKPRFLL